MLNPQAKFERVSPASGGATRLRSAEQLEAEAAALAGRKESD